MFLGGASEKGLSASVVFLGGDIVTMEPSKPRAQALAVVGRHIVSVGTNRHIRRWVGPKTKVIQLKGRMVLPGLIEAHGHLMGIGLRQMQVNLVGTKGAQEVIERVKVWARRVPKGTWLVGRGWDQNDWPEKRFPTHHLLSEAFPAHPVYLRRIDGHAAWFNKRAMSLAGVDKDTKTPHGGRIIKDKQGHPTGVMIDEAIALISKLVPPLSQKQRRSALQRALKRCLSLGITSFHDAGVSLKTVALYKDMLRHKQLLIRMYVMVSGGQKKVRDALFAAGPAVGLGHKHLTVRAIKLFADGALGSRGAALLAPYADKKSHRGLLMMGQKALSPIAKKALRSGFQLAVHAIGDRANHEVLNAYEDAFRAHPWINDPRFRVEHAQILAPRDIPRFGLLGVIPSMQPTHCTSDMSWVHRRIGAKRAKAGAYVWQSLLRTGARIAAGSDAPVESVNPFWGLYAAITRQDAKGSPKGGWYSGQRLTRQQALVASTRDAAYAAFEEKEKGSIKAGKLADLIIIDGDVFKVSPRQLRQTKVLLTMVDGEIRFQRPMTTPTPASKPVSKPALKPAK